jgi:hypothetical protein
MLSARVSIAAPNEIKVFTDELASYGEHTLETHVNKASRAGPRAENRATPFQIMPEYSYGIWHNWEFSVQLPVAEQNGAFHSNGYRAELQYVAPHDGEAGFYWGVNVEARRAQRLGEPRFWASELIPILGYRQDRWHVVANPGVTLALTGNARKVNFDPSAKVAYRTFEKNYFGVEYYLEAGPLRRFFPREERTQTLFLAWDGKVGKSDINVGVGKGFSESSDRWVLKTIFEIAFD